MADSGTHRINFSFDHHRQHLKNDSAVLYSALKTMTWRAKSVALASDQGLSELTDTFNPTANRLKSAILLSFCVGCLALCSMTSLIYLLQIEYAEVRWILATCALLLGTGIALVYFLYF